MKDSMNLLSQVKKLALIATLLMTTSVSAQIFSILDDFDRDGVLDIFDLDDDNDGILDKDENIDLNASWDFETPIVGPGNNFFGAEFQNWTLISGDGQINLIRPTHPYGDVPQVASMGNQYVEIFGEATFNRLYNVTKATSITVEIDFAPWSQKREETKIQIFHSNGTSILAESNVIITEVTDNTDWYDRDALWQTASVTVMLEPGDYYIRFRLGNYQAFDNVRVSSAKRSDFDNDGLINSLDLDSDNDGCPDAIEGGASFGWADLIDETLSNEVDANGVPIMASNLGQRVGLSLDGNNTDSECDQPRVTDDVGGIAQVNIYDDGDGIADSLWMSFDSGLNNTQTFDSLTVFWGKGSTTYYWSDVEYSEDKSSVSLSNVKLSQGVYTGKKSDGDQSRVRFYYSGVIDGTQYVDHLELPLEDHVGPVITSATLSFEDDLQTLIVSYSEPVQDDFGDLTEGLEIYQIKDTNRLIQDYLYSNFSYTINSSSSQVDQLDSLIKPRDSIRLDSQHGLSDLNGNRPHPMNAFVKIKINDSIKVDKGAFARQVDDEEEYPQFSMTLIDQSISANEYSLMHHTIGGKYELNIYNQLQAYDNIDQSLVEIKWQMYVYSNLGGNVDNQSGQISCDDDIFEGETCLKSERAFFFSWNLRDNYNRKVGVGAYVIYIKVSLYYDGELIKERPERWLAGVGR